MSDTFKADLKTVSELMRQFVDQDHVARGLHQITVSGITGWEKWWQVELALFMDGHPDICEWDVEHEFEVDRRKYDGDRLYVDFGFTLSEWNAEYVFLELKQNSDYKKCIDQMFKDAEKYELLKNRSMDGTKKRSVFVVGFFEASSWAEVAGYFESCMEHYGFELESDDYFFMPPAGHSWGMLFF